MNKWFIFLIVYLMIQQIFLTNNIYNKITLCDNYIKAKIIGPGNKKIYGDYHNLPSWLYPFRPPDVIYINGEMKYYEGESSSYYDLNENENEIKLEWSNEIDNCNGMFLYCDDIKEIDLSNFNSSKVTQMYSMFEGCSSLISLDLSNFDTSKVTLMDKMFYNCNSLISLNLSNFDTSKISKMDELFCYCNSLISLDLSSFDTNQVISMDYIFYDCNSLILLDLSSFYTSNVESMKQIFYNCNSLTSLNISNFDTSKIESMEYMFYNCNSLTSLNISNFETSRVMRMDYMFYNCSSLVSLDISSFSTSLVLYMNNMFYNCGSLTSLNLSNFDTSEVIEMNYMFCNCSNLEYLNIKNFVIDTDISCSDMFFNTPKNLVICTEDDYIKEMLSGINECRIISCSDDWKNEKNHLENNICIESSEDNKEKYNEKNNTIIENIKKDIDETYSIVTSKLANIISSVNENYINISEINETIMNNQCNLKYNLNRNEEIILINILKNLSSNISKQIIENNCSIVFMEKGFNLTLSKFILDNSFNECKINFGEYYNNIDTKRTLYLFNITSTQKENKHPEILYELFYNLDKSTPLIKINLNNLNDNCQLKTWISKCASYSIESIIDNKCLSCENNFGFYPLYNKSNSFIDCYNSIEGYYLDEENKEFKKCYQTCKTCINSGNEVEHNCISCKDGYIYENLSNSPFANCNIIDNIDNYSINNCDLNNTKYIPNNNTCISDCGKDELYKYEFNNICFEECPFGTRKSKKNEFNCEIICPKEKPYELIEFHKCIEKCTIADMFRKICKINYKEENKTIKEDLGVKIVEEILNGNLGELIKQILINDTEIIINEENSIHQITSLNYQKGNNNLSTIDFGQCQDLLRNKYNIKENEELIIYKIEHKIEGFNIPIIEYVLFNQNGSMNLNLSICDNMTIKYGIPVSINENEISKYDPSSDFYNDQCNKYSTNESIDMTLYDRKNEFNKNNLSLCESNCIFKGYNSSTSKAICDCHIKNEMTYSYDDIDTNGLLNKIQSDKSSSNLGVTQCLNVFTSSEEIKSNSGFYSLLIILIIFIIIFIIFCVKGRHLLENKIDEVIYNKFEKNKKEIQHKKNNNTILNVMEHNNYNNNKYHTKKTKKKRNKKINKIEQKTCSNINLQENKNSKEKSMIHNIVTDNLDNKKISKFNSITEISNKKEEKIIPEIPDKENDFEMNSLPYKDALKYDKRTCCEYYISLIKNKQLFAFTFCSFNDYNSGIIKKFVLFLSFALHYTINALFFNDSNMHQIYEDEGKYNFSYQFPKILISAICSTVILRIILVTLVLTDKSILKVKHQNTYELALNMKKRILKCINIKFAIFFDLNFFLLILFWFYLTCFNAIYDNTQIYLIGNTFISFGLSLIYPFIINIIPAILRIYSLDKKNNDKKDENGLYNISKIIQIL